MELPTSMRRSVNEKLPARLNSGPLRLSIKWLQVYATIPCSPPEKRCVACSARPLYQDQPQGWIAVIGFVNPAFAKALFGAVRRLASVLVRPFKVACDGWVKNSGRFCVAVTALV